MTGIYKITCLANNKCYIGQSVAIKRRWNDHQKALARGTHYNSYLQNAYNKYGKDNFIYEILESCPREKLNEREQFYIQLFDSFKNGFNCDLGGSNISGEANPMFGKSGLESPRHIDQVLQLDLFGNIIETYESANLAAKGVSGQAGHINDCLQSWKRHSPSTANTASRERFTHKGYYWIYKQDYEIFEKHNYDFTQKRNKKSLVISDLIDEGALDGDI
jgi:hypothetical protein